MHREKIDTPGALRLVSFMHKPAGESSAPGSPAPAPGPGVWLTDASLFLMALIWGVNFVVVKFATGVLPPLPFNAVRVSLAAVTLMLIASLRHNPWPDRKRTLVLLALGVLGNGVYQMLFINGVSLTRAGDASLLIAATPAFIALIGRIRGVERIGGKGWFGILLSILGIGLVSGAAALAQTSSALLGDFLIHCGALCWAFYTVLLKPYMQDVDGVKLSALTMVGGALALDLYAWRAVIATPWSAAPPAAWGAMAFSGLGALVIAYLFWYRGVRIIGPTRTAMYSNLQPVFAVLVAWMVLGEVPTAWQGIGAASIMSGLVLART
jgi:drug/metabolite transporter (DMT)-like permease